MKSPYLYVSVAVAAVVLYGVYNFFYLNPDVIFGDERRFLKEAVVLATTGEFRSGTFRAWEMPLPAMIYAGVYLLAGSEEVTILAVRGIQALLLVVQGFLISRIALVIFGDRSVAFIAYIWMLGYPYLIYYQALLLSETLFITLLVAAFYYLYRWYEKEFALNRFFFLTMLFMALATYAKATLFIFPPILIGLFYLVNRPDWRGAVKYLAMASLLYAIFLSPWWIRNYTLLGEFIPFTTGSGCNLYLGNNPANQHGGCDWLQDVDAEKTAEIKSITGEVAQNRAFASAAKTFIVENPTAFVELMVMKFSRYWSIVPNAPGFDSGLYKWVSIFTFGPVLILFLVSLWLYADKIKTYSAIILLILFFTAVHSMVIASLRYRLPLEPFMILMASAALVRIYERIRRGLG